MGVDLHYFMRKRGLTIDKIIQKHSIDSVSGFINMMAKLGVDVPKTAHDAIELALVERTEPIAITDAEIKSDADVIVSHVLDTFQRQNKKKKRYEPQKET